MYTIVYVILLQYTGKEYHKIKKKKSTNMR